jgi:hypothetical protein
MENKTKLNKNGNRRGMYDHTKPGMYDVLRNPIYYDLTCDYCGKIYDIPKAKHKPHRAAYKTHFCCADHHRKYKALHANRDRRDKTPEWQNLIKEVYQRDNWECKMCGKHGGLLNAHHIVPYKYNNEDKKENLITLCVPCHGFVHKQGQRVRKIEEYMKLMEVLCLTKL